MVDRDFDSVICIGLWSDVGGEVESGDDGEFVF